MPFGVQQDILHKIINVHWDNSISLTWVYVFENNDVFLDGGGSTGPLDFDDGGATPTASYCASTDISLFSSPTPPEGVVIIGAPTVSPASLSFGAWSVLGAAAFFPQGTVTAATATKDVLGFLIDSQGVGYYGNVALDPTTGVLAGGTVDTTASLGSVTVDASGTSITRNGVPQSISSVSISTSQSAISVTVAFGG